MRESYQLPERSIRKWLEGSEAMMSLASRRDLLAVVAPRYRAAHGQERTRILEEFVASTSYHRKYALGLLTHPLSKAPVRKPRQRARHYPFAVQQALIRCWQVANGTCSKRLVPYLPELVAVLERVGELRLDADTKTRLLALSPATADRLLQAERQRSKPHGLGTTKPGTLTKDAIPIRTFADWDDVPPGFTEVDLVAHCAESAKGEYLHSLTVTDVATGWTECIALRNRGQQVVWAGLVRVRARLPFPLLGIDSDNGVEFINEHLLRYCQQEHLTDQPQSTLQEERPGLCRAEELVDCAPTGRLCANWSIVRQLVGSAR